MPCRWPWRCCRTTACVRPGSWRRSRRPRWPHPTPTWRREYSSPSALNQRQSHPSPIRTIGGDRPNSAPQRRYESSRGEGRRERGDRRGGGGVGGTHKEVAVVHATLLPVRYGQNSTLCCCSCSPCGNCLLVGSFHFNVRSCELQWLRSTTLWSHSQNLAPLDPPPPPLTPFDPIQARL